MFVRGFCSKTVLIGSALSGLFGSSIVHADTPSTVTSENNNEALNDLNFESARNKTTIEGLEMRIGNLLKIINKLDVEKQKMKQENDMLKRRVTWNKLDEDGYLNEKKDYEQKIKDLSNKLNSKTYFGLTFNRFAYISVILLMLYSAGIYKLAHEIIMKQLKTNLEDKDNEILKLSKEVKELTDKNEKNDTALKKKTEELEKLIEEKKKIETSILKLKNSHELEMKKLDVEMKKLEVEGKREDVEMQKNIIDQETNKVEQEKYKVERENVQNKGHLYRAGGKFIENAVGIARDAAGFKLKAAEFKEQRKNDMWSIGMGTFRCLAGGLLGYVCPPLGHVVIGS